MRDAPSLLYRKEFPGRLVCTPEDFRYFQIRIMYRPRVRLMRRELQRAVTQCQDRVPGVPKRPVSPLRDKIIRDRNPLAAHKED